MKYERELNTENLGKVTGAIEVLASRGIEVKVDTIEAYLLGRAYPKKFFSFDVDLAIQDLIRYGYVGTHEGNYFLTNRKR